MANHKPSCKKCNSTGIRDFKHDAYFCDKCDEWLETKCSDKCEFCTDRPDKPSDV